MNIVKEKPSSYGLYSNKAIHGEQFSVARLVLNRYASTKQSTKNCRVIAALDFKESISNEFDS